ncbi:hypothetical protein HPB50_025935 [Hyalomma asiaticum]|uniref:Uncharacterized protein n=1 Tax=Hyalomma asiaticum TaxID=266040 RepID=A0ACB7S5E7_HYAAI|nr:hypothetical protein HPB50_025935 [Hyalomma asiaticum]
MESYEKTRAEMEYVMYAEYMLEYNYETLKRRRLPTIVRCRSYDVDDEINYKREHVMLFLPFR